MKQEPEEFRLGTLLDHEHTMRLLFLATEQNSSPNEVLTKMIDEKYKSMTSSWR